MEILCVLLLLIRYSLAVCPEIIVITTLLQWAYFLSEYYHGEWEFFNGP